eukprot:CAMPEP_0170518010 /NCGR_PEP_ID=MMETSP0209-20121228/3811_1 /TAXON_ID=665100 ORGANISM="Litonotus pictus, Strain P1" /NCGR_SAMPLE_ID=MMETSP0209 /ASSEMBLY_ACC=CAM_ASM_000301 /LENGTH=291 /DNA_ID=CAMNT_0010803421 /DNA_START=1 /DNA_END=876 /DNA_ORIENTATION=-
MKFNGDFLIKESTVEIGHEIDQGGQGKIRLGYFSDKKIVIKTFHKDTYDEKEILAYSLLKHDYMVRFHGYFIDQNESVNLVLDYAEGETLDKLIISDTMNYKQKLLIAAKLATFLSYLRDSHAIHRDLKPQNIKIKILNEEDLELKVLDFGITKITDQTMMETMGEKGTIAWAPPEIFTLIGQDKVKISFKYDVWSLGLIFSYLFSGVYPWKTTVNQVKKHMSIFIETKLINKSNFILPEPLSSNVKKLVSLCTTANSESRINPKTILNLLDMIKESKDITEIMLKEECFV